MKAKKMMALASLIALLAAPLYAEPGLKPLAQAEQEMLLAKVRNLTTSFELKADGDHVNIIVSMDSQQLESIQRRGGDVEVRLYVGPSGSERRLEHRTYDLRQSRQSFTLPYNEVCPSLGPTSVKVRTAVKGAGRDYTDSDDRQSFTCVGYNGGSDRSRNPGNSKKRRQTTLQSDVSFGTDIFGQVNAQVSVDRDQFHKITLQREGRLQVRLYAGDQRGQEKRLEGREYRMVVPSQSFTFPPSDVCDRGSFGSYDRYLKVRILPRDSTGKHPLKGMSQGESASARVQCRGLIWIAAELLDILED